MKNLKIAMKVLDVKFLFTQIAKTLLPEFLQSAWLTHTAYQCHFIYKEKGLTCFFFSNAATIEIEDVLSCLLTDLSCVGYFNSENEFIFNSFADYCSDLGYDSNSLKDKQSYEFTREETERMLDVFGPKLVKQLLEISQED